MFIIYKSIIIGCLKINIIDILLSSIIHRMITVMIPRGTTRTIRNSNKVIGNYMLIYYYYCVYRCVGYIALKIAESNPITLSFTFLDTSIINWI